MYMGSGSTCLLIACFMECHASGNSRACLCLARPRILVFSQLKSWFSLSMWIEMNDTFVIIKRTKLEETHKLINNSLIGIRFTREEEKNKQLPFLDVMV
eukprot:g14290.t1